MTTKDAIKATRRYMEYIILKPAGARIGDTTKTLNSVSPPNARRLRGRLPLMAALLALLCLGSSGSAFADKPVIDPTYANGQTVYMIGPHLITDPNPKLLEHAEELYLLVYPVNPTGSTTL